MFIPNIFLRNIGSDPVIPNAIYVSPSGNDTTGDGTQTKPYRTIQKAHDVSVAGKNIVVLEGDYAERPYLTRDGTALLPITYIAMGRVTMKGFEMNCDYNLIQGFEITETVKLNNPDSSGIYLYGAFNEIKNCYFHNVYKKGITMGATYSDARCHHNYIHDNRFEKCGGVGIETAGSYNVIEANEIWNTVMWRIAAPGLNNDADGIHPFGDNNIFRGNYIHDILQSDPETVGGSPHNDAFQVWESCTNTLIEGNYIALGEANSTPNKQAGMFGGPGINNLTFRNNIVVGTYRGWNIQGDATDTINGCKFYNETMVEVYDYTVELHYSSNSFIQNNLHYNCRGLYLDATSASTVTRSHNCHYNESHTYQGAAAAANDLRDVDPLLVNKSAGDYTLLPSSPCINAGTAIASVTEDYLGVSRPRGAGYDIGAFEA